MRDPAFTLRYEAEVETFELSELPELLDDEAIEFGLNPANLPACIAGYQEQVRANLLEGLGPADEEKIISQLESALTTRLQRGFGCRSYFEALFMNLPDLRMSSLGVAAEVGWTEVIGCALLLDLRQFAQTDQITEESMRHLHATMVQGMLTANSVGPLEATPNAGATAKALFPVFDKLTEDAVAAFKASRQETLHEKRYRHLRSAKRTIVELFEKGRGESLGHRHGRWKTKAEAAKDIAQALELQPEEVSALLNQYQVSSLEDAVRCVLNLGRSRL